MQKITMCDLCDNLNNYFERDVRMGQFEIKEKGISLPFLLNGQYFRIVGSVLNDGVYQYPCSALTDESFQGEVWALGVPPALDALLTDINDWIEKYGKSAESPYQSESFAGYSYSKASNSSVAVTWQTAFRDRLSKWRKI